MERVTTKQSLLMIRKYIEYSFQNFGWFLDKTFFQNSLFFRFFCHFFDYTSQLTHFLLFHHIGYPLFIGCFSFLVNFHYLTMKDFILKLHLFGFSKFFSIFFSMPSSFQFFVLFVLLFYHIVMINTILAFSEKLRVFMKTKYSAQIMKERHYNSGFSTAIKSAVPALTAVCIFCGNNLIEAYKVKTATDSWTKVAQSALENGREIPPHPVTLVVHTTSDTVTSIAVPPKS